MSSTSTRSGEAAGPGLPNSLEDHSIPMRQFPSKKQRLNNKLDKGFDVRLEKKKKFRKKLSYQFAKNKILLYLVQSQGLSFFKTYVIYISSVLPLRDIPMKIKCET